MKILPRSTWTSTPEGFSRRLVPARVQWVALHYPGTAAAIGAVSVERAAELLRGYRNYHRSGRGWPDIGYCYGVDQAGRVYSLAGEKVAAHSASDGYREANHEGIGVLLLIGNTEQPTAALIDSTNALIQHLRTTAGYSGIRKVYGHRQVPGASTSCPGDRVIDLLRTGRIGLDRAPAATTPAPVTPDPLEVLMSWYPNESAFAQRVANIVTKYTPRAAFDSGLTDANGAPVMINLATALRWAHSLGRQNRASLRVLSGKVSGLEVAVEQIAAGAGIDMAAIERAAYEGAQTGTAEVAAADVAELLTLQVKSEDED